LVFYIIILFLFKLLSVESKLINLSHLFLNKLNKFPLILFLLLNIFNCFRLLLFVIIELLDKIKILFLMIFLKIVIINKYFESNSNLKVISNKILMISLVKLDHDKFLLHLVSNNLQQFINSLEIGLQNGIILWHI
jgi:hypothetical protein